jgi:hypothetical protein
LRENIFCNLRNLKLKLKYSNISNKKLKVEENHRSFQKGIKKKLLKRRRILIPKLLPELAPIDSTELANSLPNSLPSTP